MHWKVPRSLWLQSKSLLMQHFLLPHSVLTRRRHFNNQQEADVVVIGSGPGGYVAAIKASQLGMKTICIEKNPSLGGTCLNAGCIPSKCLLYNSHLFDMVDSEDFAKRGIVISNVRLNLKNVMTTKLNRVQSIISGLDTLFRQNKVTVIKGKGKIMGPNVVTAMQEGGVSKIIKTKNIIIATGSEVIPFPGIHIDEKTIVSSTGALSLSNIPNRLVIIGAGAVGLELGSIWNRFGTEVTIVEHQNNIGGPHIDKEISVALQSALKRQFISFILDHKVLEVQKENNIIKVEVEDVNDRRKRKQLKGDVLLVSIGRRSFTKNLGLEELGIKLNEEGRIPVNSDFQTVIPGIFAIGDCIPGQMLSHKANEDGILCIEGIAGWGIPSNLRYVPSVISTYPEVGWIGSSEEDLKRKGVQYKVGRCPFTNNIHARTMKDTTGIVKVLSDKATGQLLGAHIIGPGASEMIAEACIAIRYGASCEDIARVSHAHSTCSKAFKNANSEVFFGKCINT